MIFNYHFFDFLYIFSNNNAVQMLVQPILTQKWEEPVSSFTSIYRKI